MPVIFENDRPRSSGGSFSLDGFRDFIDDPLVIGGLGLLAGVLDDDIGIGESLLLGAGLAGRQKSLLELRQSQQLKNEAQREELRRQARADRARQELLSRVQGQQIAPGTGRGFGLLTQQETADRVTPGLDQTDFGLFAQAFPEQAGPLIADQFASDDGVVIGEERIPFDDFPPDIQQAIVQEALANGGPMDFSNPEQARALSDRIDSVRGKEQAMETIALQQAALDAQKTRFDAKISEFESQNLQLKRDSILRESLENALDVSRTVRNLIGTAAEPGGFELTRDAINLIAKAGDVTPQWVQSTFGVNATEAARLSGLMETLIRESKGNLVLNLKKLSELGINPTDRKTSELAKITPSLENQPEDNLRNTLKILRGVKASVEATPGETFGDDNIEREIQAEIDIVERMLDVKGTSGTVNPPGATRTPILELPGGASLGNFRNE